MAQPDNLDKVRTFPQRPTPVAPQQDAPQAEAPVATPAATVEAPPATPAKKRSRRQLILGIVGLAVLAGGGWYGYGWYTDGRFIVGTDDAYVEGDIATISSKLSGYVATVNVVANQTVKKGDPLVTLDAGDFQIARDQASAQIATQQLTLKRIDAQVGGAQASVKQAQANKQALIATQQNAQLAQKRVQSLSSTAAGSQASLDNANAALTQATANLAAGDAQIAAAEANISVLQGQRAEAESALKSLQLALDKANRDLGFTVLRAPYDGVVGNLSVQQGDLVGTGTRLAALVPTAALYVDANFKETQLASLQPGQPVTVKVDALGGEEFKGTLQSIAPASGSVFSLLPAENATGNFTKVVQRVPVRIALSPDVLQSGKLRAGLSVTVDADSREATAR